MGQGYSLGAESSVALSAVHHHDEAPARPTSAHSLHDPDIHAYSRSSSGFSGDQGLCARDTTVASPNVSNRGLYMMEMSAGERREEPSVGKYGNESSAKTVTNNEHAINGGFMVELGEYDWPTYLTKSTLDPDASVQNGTNPLVKTTSFNLKSRPTSSNSNYNKIFHNPMATNDINSQTIITDEGETFAQYGPTSILLNENSSTNKNAENMQEVIRSVPPHLKDCRKFDHTLEEVSASERITSFCPPISSLHRTAAKSAIGLLLTNPRTESQNNNGTFEQLDITECPTVADADCLIALSDLDKQLLDVCDEKLDQFCVHDLRPTEFGSENVPKCVLTNDARTSELSRPIERKSSFSTANVSRKKFSPDGCTDSDSNVPVGFNRQGGGGGVSAASGPRRREDDRTTTFIAHELAALSSSPILATTTKTMVPATSPQTSGSSMLVSLSPAASSPIISSPAKSGITARLLADGIKAAVAARARVIDTSPAIISSPEVKSAVTLSPGRQGLEELGQQKQYLPFAWSDIKPTKESDGTDIGQGREVRGINEKDIDHDHRDTKMTFGHEKIDMSTYRRRFVGRKKTLGPADGVAEAGTEPDRKFLEGGTTVSTVVTGAVGGKASKGIDRDDVTKRCYPFENAFSDRDDIYSVGDDQSNHNDAPPSKSRDPIRYAAEYDAGFEPDDHAPPQAIRENLERLFQNELYRGGTKKIITMDGEEGGEYVRKLKGRCEEINAPEDEISRKGNRVCASGDVRKHLSQPTGSRFRVCTPDNRMTTVAVVHRQAESSDAEVDLLDAVISNEETKILSGETLLEEQSKVSAQEESSWQKATERSDVITQQTRSNNITGHQLQQVVMSGSRNVSRTVGTTQPVDIKKSNENEQNHMRVISSPPRNAWGSSQLSSPMSSQAGEATNTPVTAGGVSINSKPIVSVCQSPDINVNEKLAADFQIVSRTKTSPKTTMINNNNNNNYKNEILSRRMSQLTAGVNHSSPPSSSGFLLNNSSAPCRDVVEYLQHNDSFISLSSSQSSSIKPIAMVQPRKVQGVRVLPSSAVVAAGTLRASRRPASPLERSRPVTRSPAVRALGRQSAQGYSQNISKTGSRWEEEGYQMNHLDQTDGLKEIERTGRVKKLLENCQQQQQSKKTSQVLEKVQRIESEESYYARLVRHQEKKLLRSMQQKQLQLQQKQLQQQKKQQQQLMRTAKAMTMKQQKLADQRPRSRSTDDSNWECKPLSYQSDGHSPMSANHYGRRSRRHMGGTKTRRGTPTIILDYEERADDEDDDADIDRLNVNEKLLLSRKKEAEIAALLHHLRLDAVALERSPAGSGSASEGADSSGNVSAVAMGLRMMRSGGGYVEQQQTATTCDFERSLGYFP